MVWSSIEWKTVLCLINVDPSRLVVASLEDCQGKHGMRRFDRRESQSGSS